MKAAIYKEAGRIDIEEIELQKCGPQDVIVKNLYAGICGSDIYTYKYGGDGHFIYAGSEFGHEMVSRIVEIGSEVKDLSVGQRVYPYPIHAKGDRKRAGSTGGFSEFVHLPNCELGKSVFLVDEAISDRVAAMIEPFTVGSHAAKVGNPKQGQNAVVFGAGIIGISAAIALKEMGIAKVLVADIADFRLQKARELGFAVCNTHKENLQEAIRAEMGTTHGLAGEGLDADLYIDATGIKEIPQTFQKIAKFAATLVVVGVHHEPRELDLMSLTYRQHTIRGSAGYDMDDVKFVMDLMKRQSDKLETLITHEYAQEQLEQAIRKAMNAEETVKVAIKY